MQEASFTGPIRILFYIILFYYVFKFAMRLLLPILMRKAVQKAEENMRRQFQPDDFDRNGIRKPVQQKQKPSEPVGEYVTC